MSSGERVSTHQKHQQHPTAVTALTGAVAPGSWSSAGRLLHSLQDRWVEATVHSHGAAMSIMVQERKYEPPV